MNWGGATATILTAGRHKQEGLEAVRRISQVITTERRRADPEQVRHPVSEGPTSVAMHTTMAYCVEQGTLLDSDFMINRGCVAGSATSPTWRVWLVGFVIAVVGLTAWSNAWHAEHAAESNCVVCEFENDPCSFFSIS